MRLRIKGKQRKKEHQQLEPHQHPVVGGHDSEAIITNDSNKMMVLLNDQARPSGEHEGRDARHRR